uniref:Secreted protein n=1 Tax=Molossus molossus TaxID=27622 RepID=A0A7J8GQZ5_MOLMO|nr:hypothetical protein HJG59_011269 [Molossus molossus]
MGPMELSRLMELLSMLIWMMETWLFTFAETQKTVDLRYVYFMIRIFNNFFSNLTEPNQCGSVVEHRPRQQEVTGSIPGQGTCPGCGPEPQWGACRRRPIDILSHQCFYLSLPLTSSLSKINKEKNFKNNLQNLSFKF